ncbi:MAG: ABC transporter permease, partial [Holophagales bacterium]|nr:ABC transporter permease [Holophagales bacterium]
MFRDRLAVWILRLRQLLLPGRDERETADEMAFHLEQATREHLERGASPEEAKRLARLEFGAVESYRAQSRDARFGRGLEMWLRDLRLGLRRLLRAPAFTLLTLLTLSLGLGAAGAIWGVAHSLLFPAMPYPEPDRIVVFHTSWVEKPRGGASPAEVLDYEDRLGHVLGSIGASASGRLTLLGDGHATRASAAWVTQGLFGALGAPLVLGRGFTEEDVRQGAGLAVLSHRLWRERFGGDPEIVGEVMQVSGGQLEIVGVLGPGFDLPQALARDERHDLFLPMPIQPPVTTRGNHFLSVVARLGDGVGLATAKAAVQALAHDFETRFPDGYPPDMGFRVTLVPLADELRGPMRAPLAVLGLVVALLLFIAITNVLGLVLARLETRSHELALTTALGAGRAQLLRQVGLEHGLLVAAGGLGGLALAHWGTLTSKSLLPPSIGHLIVPRPASALVVGVLTLGLILLSTLAPLASASRWDLAARLRRA